MATREEDEKKYSERRNRHLKKKKNSGDQRPQPSLQQTGQSKNNKYTFGFFLSCLTWQSWKRFFYLSIVATMCVGGWMEQKGIEGPMVFIIPAFVFGSIHLLYLLYHLIVPLFAPGVLNVSLHKKQDADSSDDSDRRQLEHERRQREYEYRSDHKENFGDHR